jgi:hypothetical protein
LRGATGNVCTVLSIRSSCSTLIVEELTSAMPCPVDSTPWTGDQPVAKMITYTKNKQTHKQIPWPLVRERTIPTERPPITYTGKHKREREADIHQYLDSPSFSVVVRPLCSATEYILALVVPSVALLAEEFESPNDCDCNSCRASTEAPASLGVSGEWASGC